MERWRAVESCLEEFQQHLAPHVPKFELRFADDSTWTDERYEEEAKTGVFGECGVYLIFNENEALQYIGVAMNGFARRIWMHDEDVDRRYTDLISIPRQFYFLAPALEFFLVCRLRPPKNKVYRNYTIPPWEPDVAS